MREHIALRCNALLPPDWGLTAAIGVAVFPDAAVDPESLLRAADIALYRAKDSGARRRGGGRARGGRHHVGDAGAAPEGAAGSAGGNEQLLAVEAELLDRLADVVEGAVLLGLARPLASRSRDTSAGTAPSATTRRCCGSAGRCRARACSDRGSAGRCRCCCRTAGRCPAAGTCAADVLERARLRRRRGCTSDALIAGSSPDFVCILRTKSSMSRQRVGVVRG